MEIINIFHILNNNMNKIKFILIHPDIHRSVEFNYDWMLSVCN